MKTNNPGETTMTTNELLKTAQDAYEEAVKLATDGPRRVKQPDVGFESHEDGFLLPSAVMNKMTEASEALGKIAKQRHGFGSH